MQFWERMNANFEPSLLKKLFWESKKYNLELIFD